MQVQSMTLTEIEAHVLDTVVKVGGTASTEYLGKSVVARFGPYMLGHRDRRVDNALRKLKRVGRIEYKPAFRVWALPVPPVEVPRG